MTGLLMTEKRRPRLGVFKLASCDGCQLQLLGLDKAALHGYQDLR